MLQLSLPVELGSRTLAEELDAWVALTSARTVHVSLVAEAARITASRFRSWAGAPLCAAERMRVRAYSRAVLRRMIIDGRDEAASCARRRLVAASIQADLLEAGWDAAQAAEEAARMLGGGWEAVA